MFLGPSISTMPSHCAVAICKSPQDASYYHFPTDPKLCKRWVSACKRKRKFNTRTSRICDRHFLTCDFIRDLQNELLNGRIRKHLKAGAVPTINLLPTENKRHIRTERNNRAIKRERKEIVKNLLLRGKNKFCSTCYWKILLYF